MSDGNKPRQEINTLLGIGLVDHALIPAAVCTGLVGVDPGDKYQFILYLIVYGSKAVYIIANSILIVS